MYHVLTLLGGRPTCRELRARLHAHLGLSLPDPLLPILLDQYAALPSAADGDEDALLPRINTLRYLQHRILGHNTEDALPPLSPPKPAAAEAENAAGPPAQLDRSLVVLVTEEQLEEALRWSIVRRVPGRAGLLRDACWLFGMVRTHGHLHPHWCWLAAPVVHAGLTDRGAGCDTWWRLRPPC